MMTAAPAPKLYIHMRVPELLATPRRPRDGPDIAYDSILICSSGRLDPCGYLKFCVIGMTGKKNEGTLRHLLTSSADSIVWKNVPTMDIECCPASGAMHFHNLPGKVVAGPGDRGTMTISGPGPL